MKGRTHVETSSCLCAPVFAQPGLFLATQTPACREYVVLISPLILCPALFPQLPARKASGPWRCPRDQRRWGSSWASVQGDLLSSSSSWGPSSSSSARGERGCALAHRWLLPLRGLVGIEEPWLGTARVGWGLVGPAVWQMCGGVASLGIRSVDGPKVDGGKPETLQM